NDVELLVVERFADVHDASRVISASIADLLAARFEKAPVRIDEARHLYVLEPQILVDVRIPLAVNSRLTDADDVIGPQHFAGGLCAADREQWKHGAGRGGLPEETASRDLVHGILPEETTNL